MFNKLLERQISKYLGEQKNIPSKMLALLEAVSDSYNHFEKDRNILQRTMELNSAELSEANKKLKEEAEENKLVFKKLRESLMLLREEDPGSNEIFGENDLKMVSIAELLKNESTKRKEAETRLKEYLNDLEKINKELDQFTYVVSHDLKAPLRAISSLTSFLEEDLCEKLNDESKENLLLLKNRVARMENFINGLLEYSRAAKSSNVETVETGVLINEIIGWLDCPDHIKIRTQGIFPVLKTDRIKIEQVLSNLITNAIKYNNKKEGTIEIGCNDFEDWTQFYIQDNGPGIEKQFHDKIFELFHTLESRDIVESTGIGLAIVKKIIEDHGGKIWVESEPGNGTRFTFTYPKIITNELIKKI
ncbi:MAG: ATP-binding protein [Bacteroidota bacterium]